MRPRSTTRALLALGCGLVLAAPLAARRGEGKIAAPQDRAVERASIAIVLPAGETDVPFGRTFDLVLVRTWRSDVEPDAWRDDQLQPLHARTRSVVIERDAEVVRETRTLSVAAFQPGPLRVEPAFVAAPRAGGEAFATRGEPLVLNVLSALGDDPDLAPESPGPPVAISSFPRIGAALVLIALGVALALLPVLERRRRRRLAATHPLPEEVAEARLAALEPTTAGDRAYFGALSHALRAYLAGRFGFPAPERGTGELLALPSLRRMFLPRQLARLEALLSLCDRVRFEGVAAGVEERARARAEAQALVRETRGPALEALARERARPDHDGHAGAGHEDPDREDGDGDDAARGAGADPRGRR